MHSAGEKEKPTEADMAHMVEAFKYADLTIPNRYRERCTWDPTRRPMCGRGKICPLPFRKRA